MKEFFLAIAVIVAFLCLLSLYRGIRGPTVFDRLLGVNVVGTKTVILLLLIGIIYGRLELFVDISLVYAILNFVGILAFSKYVESK
ncbi:MAG: pH regulation protein F [Deltaproteobacteria bacterium]|nr:MAG: pH regulation protein F [Deltaproteobacteria bacterium]